MSLPLLTKTLYKSTNDHIKVRAIVDLCKLRASGWSDAALRPFADGSSSKLVEACRMFLVTQRKILTYEGRVVLHCCKVF